MENHSAENVLQALLDRFTLLYGTRIHLLDHLLTAIGNGFKWKDGMPYEKYAISEIEPFLSDNIIERADVLTDQSVYAQTNIPYHFHHLDEHSLVLNIPDDIRSDWLEIVCEWLRYLLINNKITEHDTINDYTKNRYIKANKLLHEVATKYLDEHVYTELAANCKIVNTVDDVVID